jgi:hypothetical protein
MRIRTNGGHEWRTDLYDDTAEHFNEGTRSGGIDVACEFSTEMLRNLERAVNHPDMTEELADVLSTRVVNIEYRVETDVEID